MKKYIRKIRINTKKLIGYVLIISSIYVFSVMPISVIYPEISKDKGDFTISFVYNICSQVDINSMMPMSFQILKGCNELNNIVYGIVLAFLFGVYLLLSES